jgi:hypothetical protein
MARCYTTNKKLLTDNDDTRVSDIINPVTENILAKKPLYGIANEDVPDHLKDWICTPQKFNNFMQGKQ